MNQSEIDNNNNKSHGKEHANCPWTNIPKVKKGKIDTTKDGEMEELDQPEHSL